VATVIEEFIERTSGGRDAAIALLRETIFYINTGKWPDHLGERKWRVYDKEGEKATWCPSRSEHRD